MTLARLVQQKLGFREVALPLGRSPSTINRELQHSVLSSGYASAPAYNASKARM